MADRTVTVSLLARVEGFVAGLKTAQAATTGFVSSLEKSAAKQAALKNLGNAAGVMGAVAAAGFIMVVKSAADFEQAMSNVQAATHETSANMGLLRQAALDAGAATVFSAGDAAKAEEELAKAGVSTSDILGGALAGSMNLAAAGGLSVGDAAEIAATAMTQFGLSGSSVGHIADLLAAGAGKAQGSVADMGMALKQSGLVANQMGISIEDTTGTLAAFASAGLIGSDAGTSFKSMLLKLENPSTQATAALKKYNISAYDAKGNFVGMTDLAGQLHNKLGDLTMAQRNQALATIFGSDAIRSASILYENGAKGMEKWNDKVNEQGYAAETAKLRMDNLNGSFEQLKGSLETAMIGTGDGATGPIRVVVDALTDLLNAYNKLPGPIKSVMGMLTGVSALIGLGGFAAVKAVNGYTTLTKSMQTLGIAGKTAEGGVEGLTKKQAALRGGALVAGAALLTLSASLGDTHDSMKAVTDAAGFAAIGFSIGGPWGAGIGAMVGTLKGLLAVDDDVVNSMKSLNTAMSDPMAFQAQALGISKSTDAIGSLNDKANLLDNNIVQSIPVVSQFASILGDHFSGEADKATASVEANSLQVDKNRASISALMNGLNPASKGFVDYTHNVGMMTDSMDAAAPVLKKMGLSVQEVMDIQQLHGSSGEQWQNLIAEYKATQIAMDSVSGRSDTVAQSFSDISNQAILTADSATALGNALDALIAPAEGGIRAADAWTSSLHSLSASLDKNNKTLVGNSDAAITNRTAVLDRADALRANIKAQAAAGAGSVKLAHLLDNGVSSLMATGKAAGLNTNQLRGMLNQMHLTPKLIKTVLQSVGVDKATNASRNLAAAYNKLPHNVRTKIAADGIPKTDAGIRKLGQSMKLTPKQINILLHVHDDASVNIDHVKAKVKDVDGATGTGHVKVDTGGSTAAVDGVQRGLTHVDTITATPKINVNGGNSLGVIGGITHALQSVPASISRSITLTTNHVTNYTTHGTPPGSANGNIWPSVQAFSVGGIPENHTAQIAPAGAMRLWAEPETGGEAYIPLAPAKRARSVSLWAQTGHLLGLYANGAITAFANGGTSGGGGHGPDGKELVKALRALGKDIKHFDVTGKQTAADTRSEMHSLLDGLKAAFGKDSHIVDHLRKMGDHLISVQKTEDKNAADLVKAQGDLKDTLQEANAYSKSVADALTHDAFSGTAADSMLQLKADRNDAREMGKDLAAARKRGLSGKLLREIAASGNTGLADELAHMSRKEIKQYEKLLAQRNAATGKVGDQTAHALYGDQIKEETKAVKQLEHTVAKLDRTLEHLEHRIERGAHRGVRDAHHHRDHRNHTNRKSN